MSAESGVARELHRVAFGIETQPVKIKTLHDVKSIPLGSGKVGPFRKGNSYSIPLWQAIILREFNLVEPEDSVPISRSDIQKQVSREATTQKLSGFPNHFYISARGEEDVIEAHVKANLEPKDNLKRFHAYLYDLVQARLSKILKLATSPPSRATLQEIPEEEQILLARLSKLIGEWSAFLLNADKSN